MMPAIPHMGFYACVLLRPELQAISNYQCCPRLFGDRFFAGFPDGWVGMPKGCRTDIGPKLLGNGDHPRTVHFHGHRALEKGHRQDEAMTALEVHQDSLKPA